MPPLNNFQKSCIAVAVGQALVTGAAQAAIIEVGDDPTTECTLADAVQAANMDTVVNSCTAGSGADVIRMHNLEVLFSTTASPFSALQISSDITIEGKSNGATTGGGLIGRDTSGPEMRLFDVTSSGNLTLMDIAVVDGRLTNGDSGGGIFIASGGSLTLMNSTLTRNLVSGAAARGGAIFAAGGTSVALSYSNINNNSATSGGAIAVVGGESGSTLTSSINSISSNRATEAGGGVWLNGKTTATITNNKLTSNSAGYEGGALYSSANSVTVNGGEFDANRAGYSGGALALRRGSTHFESSKAFYNLAGARGGFASVSGSASLSVSQSSIVQNRVGTAFGPTESTTGVGGAIAISADGIHTIANTTISSNRAADGGAIYMNDGSLTIINSTLVGGQGVPAPEAGYAGIALDARNTAAVTLQNSVLARGGEGYRYGGEYGAPAGTSRLGGRLLCVTSGAATINSAAGNLLQDTSCGGPATANIGLSRLRFGYGQNSYQVGTMKGGSGGGSSYTSVQTGRQKYHAPVFSSAMLGAGNVTICSGADVDSQDQRGRSRSGPACDSGAIQAAIGSIVVDTPSDDTSSASTNCSLRDALAAVGGESGDLLRPGATCTEDFDISSISFDPAIFPASDNTQIALTGQLPQITKSVSIEGPGKNALTIDGGGVSQLLSAFGSHLYISGLTLANGSSFRAAALSTYSSKASLNSVDIINNVADRDAGAVSAVSTELTLTNVTISGNSVTQNGVGGIRTLNNGLAIIENSTISGNLSNDTSTTTSIQYFGRYAGGLYVGRDNLSILRNSTVSGNSSVRTGGGIAIRNASLFMLNSTVSGNTADVRGGGIYIQQYLNEGPSKYSGGETQAIVINSIVSGNRKGAGSYGVGIPNYGSEITMASWRRPLGGSRIAGDPIDLIEFSSVFGDSAANYSQAFYSYAGVTTSLDINNSFVATSTDIAGNPNANSTALNRIIGPLANNGGMTLTHNLVEGSPAINGGESEFCEGLLFRPLVRDQRSFPRSDGACDIGSVEYENSSCFVAVGKNSNVFTFCL